MNKIADFAFAEVPFIFTKHEVLSKDNTEVPFILFRLCLHDFAHARHNK
jgi:hypothetical protein